MKTSRPSWLAVGLSSALLVLMSLQPVLASPSYEGSSTISSGGGGTSAGTVLAIAVGVAVVASSIDCASQYPSFGMCQEGGSSYRGPQPAEWGSMGSLIQWHDAMVGPE